MVEEEGKFEPEEEIGGEEKEISEREKTPLEQYEPGPILSDLGINKENLANAMDVCQEFFLDKDGNELEVNGESFTEFKELLSTMDIDDATGYLFGWLIEQGVDPEEFLIEKGILQNPETEE